MKKLPVSNRFRRQLPSVLVLFSIAFSFLPTAARAQTAPEKTRQLVAEEAAVNEKRLALVIGNSDYQNTVKLPNAANDAIDMAAALRGLGFEVIERVNQDERGMDKAISEFGERLKQAGVGLVFYAGHGVQYNGRNYLVPVDAVIRSEDEIIWDAIDINKILGKFSGAKTSLNIMILDACRNNPFAKDWSEFRDVSKDMGLAKIDAPNGTILFYATAPGKVASDGKGRNGLFTEVLLQEIKKPNVEFDALYKSVASKVSSKSGDKQRPYRESSATRDFYFAGTTDTPTPGRQPAVATSVESESGSTKTEAAAREREAWDAVKSQTNAKAFRIYLENYPTSANARTAKDKLEQLIWNSVKTSNDKAKLLAYLDEFPKGANAATAKIKLSQIESDEAAADAPAETEDAPPAKVKPKVATPKIEKPKISPVPTAAKKPRGKAQPIGKIELRTNSVGMKLVNIPAGSFMMGLSEKGLSQTLTQARKEYADEDMSTWFDNEKLPRNVTIADGFWMGETEVTQAQWAAVMGENPSLERNCDRCPVERVSWEMVKTFIEKLNAGDNEFEYRLPSEAEWEYAARAGTPGLFAGAIDEIMWHNGNAEGKTHPVGQMQANPFGLYDMHGNVEEWCEDFYNQTYDGLPVDGSPNTKIGDAKYRVVRGGSWNNFSTKSRSTFRKSFRAGAVSPTTGFRVVARLK